MCTLIALMGVGAPLVVAANRDERLDRPAAGPRWWPGERFMAPVDEKAGGTWLGLHESGLFVGVTNRAESPYDPARRSRGQLVVEALRLGAASAVHRALASTLDPHRYNPFHLFYADVSGDAFVTWFDGHDVRQQRAPPGVVVVTERSLGGDDHGRERRIRRSLGPLVANQTPPSLDALAGLLREHDEADPIASTCVHVPALRYGTRSSLLLEVHDPARQSRWLWAEGPPCVTPYVEVPLR